MVIEKQIALILHTDDSLMAYVLPRATTDCAKKLDTSCGQNYYLTVTKGKIHEHLGVTKYFRIEGRRMLTQRDSIKKIWTTFP